MHEVKNISDIRSSEAKKCKSGNTLFFGDNLIVLKRLLNDSEVFGKVRLVYIDPPFATNQEFTVSNERSMTISRSNSGEIAYSDKLKGSEYLSFLRKRLYLLRELLADDGSIYVHIDYKMGHYVKVLIDEVFGGNRFINDITRIKCNPKNFFRRGYGNIKDMILFYSKTSDYIWNEQRETMSEEEIDRLYPKIDEEGRRYTTTPLHAPGETQNGATGQNWNGIKPPIGRHWRYPPEVLSRLDREGRIHWSSTNNPRLIIYADSALKKGKKIQDIWEYKDPQYPSYPTEKNIDLLKRIIKTSSDTGDLVLDCFAGSGTTLLAASFLERNWIGIDNSTEAVNTAEHRLESFAIDYNKISL